MVWGTYLPPYWWFCEFSQIGPRVPSLARLSAGGGVQSLSRQCPNAEYMNDYGSSLTNPILIPSLQMYQTMIIVKYIVFPPAWRRSWQRRPFRDTYAGSQGHHLLHQRLPRDCPRSGQGKFRRKQQKVLNVFPLNIWFMVFHRMQFSPSQQMRWWWWKILRCSGLNTWTRWFILG